MARHPNPNRPRYSAMIGTARRAKGWTQNELAKITHLAPEAIKKYEAGQRMPDYETLYTICSVLDLNINDLGDYELHIKDSVSTYQYYIERPFKEFCQMVDDNIRISTVNSNDSGYDIVIQYTDSNGKVHIAPATQQGIIEKSAKIKRKLQDQYRYKLQKELTKLAIAIATKNSKS